MAAKGAVVRGRLLILLVGCLLAASAAWADDVGYIDCSNHPENTRVLAKAGKTSEVVTSLPCGERFTILLQGEFFSRIQTKDGKVGYLYTYQITRDSSVTSVPQASPRQVPAPASNVPAPSVTAAQPKPSPPTQAVPAPNVPAPSVTAVQPKPTPPTQSVPASNVPALSVTAVQPKPTPPTEPAPLSNAPPPSVTAAQPKPTPPTQSVPAPNVPPPSVTAAQPKPTPPTESQPIPAQPAPQVPQAAGGGAGWGRPVFVPREPRVELFGGYAYLRFGGSGYGGNINGALGSFGWNIKPWLQIVADASYILARSSGTKNVIYGNHGGVHFSHRGRNKWGATPFVEALFGGTRIDTTVSGLYGSQSSQRGFSMKAGGGLDLKISPHFTIRLLDVNYYRIPFLLNSQNNYWASAGFVLRLGGRPE